MAGKRKYRKKRFRKKGMKKRGGPNTYRPQRDLLINPIANRTAMPPRFRTKFITNLDGWVDVDNTIGGDGFRYFVVNAANVYQPYVPGSYFTDFDTVGDWHYNISTLTLDQVNSKFVDQLLGYPFQPAGPFPEQFIPGIWSKYRVMGAKLEVQFITSNTTDALDVVLVPFNTNMAFGDINTASNSALCSKHKLMCNTQGGNTNVLSAYWSTARVHGITQQVAMTLDYAGEPEQPTTSPLNPCYIQVCLQDVSPSTGVLANILNWRFKLTQYVELSDLQDDNNLPDPDPEAESFTKAANLRKMRIQRDRLTKAKHEKQIVPHKDTLHEELDKDKLQPELVSD